MKFIETKYFEFINIEDIVALVPSDPELDDVDLGADFYYIVKNGNRHSASIDFLSIVLQNGDEIDMDLVQKMKYAACLLEVLEMHALGILESVNAVISYTKMHAFACKKFESLILNCSNK